MTTSDCAESKRALRRRFRAVRRALDARARARFDQDIRNHIRHAMACLQARCIAAYWACDGEPDLRPLLDRSIARGKVIALPVVQAGGRLVFREWRPGSEIDVNRFGIPEPAGGATLSLDQLDLILIPLLAWDRSGQRLGVGGGYYDRLLRKHRDADRPKRVGVAYGLQEAEAVPVEAWDIPLHAVVTERGWFTCPG